MSAHPLLVPSNAMIARTLCPQSRPVVHLRALRMTDVRAFRGFRFPAEVILWAVRWYLRFPISCRDVEAMLADRASRLTTRLCTAGCSASPPS